MTDVTSTDLIDHGNDSEMADDVQGNHSARSTVSISVIYFISSTQISDCLRKALVQSLDLQLVEVKTVAEVPVSNDICCALAEFEGPDFSYAHARGFRVFEPTVILECAALATRLPAVKRPLFCQSMSGVVVCFTGFRSNKRRLIHVSVLFTCSVTFLSGVRQGDFVTLVHHMGGSVRKELTTSVTHLIAQSASGPKYRLACGWGKPVMDAAWISLAWDRRHDVSISAQNTELMQRGKLKVFQGCIIAFLGFNADEETQMRTSGIKAGATLTKDLSQCDHLVVDNSYTAARIENKNCFVVTAEVSSGEGVPRRVLSPSVSDGRPLQSRSNRKSASHGRLHLSKSSSADLLGGSSLDMSSDASVLTEMYSIGERESLLKSPPQKLASKRFNVCCELNQTEQNYFQILETIVRFKKELEVVAPGTLPSDRLLNDIELKQIFGNLQAIHDTHEKIKTSLANAITKWQEYQRIGKIWIENAEQLQMAYPPFINFFQATVDTVQFCEKTKPRFHAFLKACQSRPECGRQSLQELLIRPVQRLPSVCLLLNDIMKHTDKNNPDKRDLEVAISKLKGVLEHINEDKRKTESTMHVFQVFSEIDCAPPNLISSHRHLISRVDVVELTHRLYSKDALLTLFLFTDCLEVCKKREKNATNNASSLDLSIPRSPAPGKMTKKPYKHVKMISLAYIKRVFDVDNCEGLQKLFGFRCRFGNEGRESGFEKSYAFSIVESACEIDKRNLLDALVQNVANTVCKFDLKDTFIQHVTDLSLFDIPAGSLKVGTFSRSMRHAGRSISRVMSFNKGSSSFKRTFSTIALHASNTLSRMSRSNLRLPDLPETPTSVSKHGTIKRLDKSDTMTSVCESPSIKRKDSTNSSRFLVPFLPRHANASSHNVSASSVCSSAAPMPPPRVALSKNSTMDSSSSLVSCSNASTTQCIAATSYAVRNGSIASSCYNNCSSSDESTAESGSSAAPFLSMPKAASESLV